MGKFDKYISRFDEIEGKKGKGPRADSDGKQSLNRRRMGVWAGILLLLLVVGGVVYGPRLAGATDPANVAPVDPAAQQDRESLRAMPLDQVKAAARERVARRDELKRKGASKDEVAAADSAAWRANAVAWEKTPH